MDSTTWLILVVVMLVIEIITLGLTTLWFAGGALVAFIASLCGAPLIVQIILFIVVSIILLLVTRPLAVKYFNKDRIRTNAESLIGARAIVISEIDNLQGIGQVTVGGQEWSAKAKDSQRNFQPGEVVDIVEIQGVKLIVEESKEEN